MRIVPVFALLALLTSCGEQPPAYPRREPPKDLLRSAAQRRAGSKLFHEHCARCHGTTGEGRSPRAEFFRPPAPDFLSSRYRSADPAYLFWRISKGKTVEPYLSQGSVMPAWGQYLSEEEIWQLVAYLLARPGSDG